MYTNIGNIQKFNYLFHYVQKQGKIQKYNLCACKAVFERKIVHTFSFDVENLNTEFECRIYY